MKSGHCKECGEVTDGERRYCSVHCEGRAKRRGKRLVWTRGERGYSTTCPVTGRLTWVGSRYAAKELADMYEMQAVIDGKVLPMPSRSAPSSPERLQYMRERQKKLRQENPEKLRAYEANYRRFIRKGGGL